MQRKIFEYREYLTESEKSPKTIEKYIRDIISFLHFSGTQEITKELTVEYKQKLIVSGYAPASINSMLSALNSYLEFIGMSDCRVKRIHTQRRVYSSEDCELTKEEYFRLLKAARNKPLIYHVIQTICGTGIRVSELKYFTVEGVKKGEINVRCKNKNRTVIIPTTLRKMLMKYAEANGIECGMIFVSKNGKPIDRSVIWARMKELGEKAGVPASKVYPHNLRKLFAREFYGENHDIAKLADVLGHGSIETTRIYIMTTSAEHRRYVEQLGLVVDS